MNEKRSKIIGISIRIIIRIELINLLNNFNGDSNYYFVITIYAFIIIFLAVLIIIIGH